MKLDRFRHPRSVSIVLVLVLSILGLVSSLTPAHATGPLLVQSATPLGLQDGASPESLPGPMSIGDLIIVHVFCMAGGDTVNSVSDAAGTTYTELLHIGRAHIWTGFAKGTPNGVIVNLNCNFGGSPSASFSVEEFSGVASIGNVVTDNAGCTGACTTTRTITIGTNNAAVYDAFDVYGGGLGACPTITNGASLITSQTLTCLGGLAGAYSLGRTVYATNRGIGGNSFSMQTSNSQSAAEQLVELDPPGGTPSNLGTQTACFGNCGNPAVTLANTNSTHSVNFNQSITLFYQFQSNLNGQVLNVTTNVAKTYSNGNSLVLGVYTVPVCSPGQPAFTPICPGALQKATVIQNPVKGPNTFTNLAIPVSNGQWVGLAFTATFSGMDLNDTNTLVPLSQAQSGSVALPPSISVSTPFGNTKVGLWAFLTGNTITGIPPPPTTGGNCAGLLDCILPNLVFSLCTSQTPQCQNASALLWSVVLTIFTMYFVFKGMGGAMPGVHIPFGEIFMLCMLVWIFILSGLQLLFVWVPLFFFFVISLMLGKKTGHYL